MRIGSQPISYHHAPKTTKAQELAKAKGLYEKADLASVLGNCEVKVSGKVSFKATTNPNVVVAEGKGHYNDLWGGEGNGKFKLEINVKTGKVTGSWE